MATEIDREVIELLRKLTLEGIRNAAKGFSGMIGEELTVVDPDVRLINISEIPGILGGPENEAVGIYLRAEGNLVGQMMLVVPYAKALELSDLLMGNPEGTTTQLGRLERSALGELGNITSAFFLNSVAQLTGLEARPSPPAVMVDMVGAILDIIIATTGGVSEQVMLMQATFGHGEKKVEAEFWVIPDLETLKLIVREQKS